MASNRRFSKNRPSKNKKNRPPAHQGRRRHEDEERDEPEDELASELGIPPKKQERFLEDVGKITRDQLQSWHDESASLTQQWQRQKPVSLLDSLDDWQRLTYDALEAGKNVVVDAPTTAGKTRAVETYFTMHINNPDFRAAYTTPVKSLSNDKVREFREMFGRDKVGIATGDIKENLGAPIVVTTLETYRNSLLGVEPDLDRTLVVFDEYHFMQDESRGSAWEEAIILTPDSCQLLLLSASVANATEFVAWLEKIHSKPCLFVKTEHRPVPLTSVVYIKDRWLLAGELPGQAQQKPRNQREPFPLPIKKLAPRMAPLIDLGLTPCIIYAGRRKSTELIAHEVAKNLPPLPEDDRKLIGEVLMKEQQDSKALTFIDHSLRMMIQTYGVAYHHSGMAPAARVAVEALLKQGKLRFCSATMGLSIGINFSVRSALISDFQRPGERGLSRYAPSEVLQMLGRAGRRGRDVYGYSLWPSLESYRTLSGAKRDRCDSRLKNDPTTFLGLVGQGRSAKDLETFYSRSFMRFGDSGVDLGLIRRNRLEQKLGTKDLPCISPAHEFARFQHKGDTESKCRICPHQRECHRYIQAKVQNDLAALHLHLHDIGALNPDDKLTPYGELGKYLPQSGGLIVAKFIHDGTISEKNLGACAELMAALSLARHKNPYCEQHFQFPFDAAEIDEMLEYFYPQHLFPELYDPPFGRRHHPIIREFNPEAAYAIRCWIQGMSWKDLARRVTTEKFAEGDLISLIYRVASYLQSLAQAHYGEFSRSAAILRDEMLREPLSVTL